uniref:ATP synthase complex subunit 8 n=1 Tax=Holotrichia oblita TaxID=644536 RepID=A0A7T1M837_HOLOL|nr:ATP synthase F0 subunit 8 [Holotrichia oblita]
MPQMAPMSWLILFFLFIVVFMLFNVLTYFSFIYPVKSFKKKKIDKKIYWKW